MRAPRQEELISEAIRAALENVHTSEPGWVVDYDPDSRTCTVQAANAQPYTRENGDRAAQAKPPTRRAQVAFHGGVAFNLKPGDQVMIHYCSTSLDNWSHGRTKVVDPGDDRRFSLSDAIVQPLGSATEKPGDDEYILQYGKVKLGDKGLVGTRSPVVRRSDLTALRSEITTFTAANPTNPANAALTLIAGFLLTVINAMSDNVEAT